MFFTLKIKRTRTGKLENLEQLLGQQGEESWDRTGKLGRQKREFKRKTEERF